MQNNIFETLSIKLLVNLEHIIEFDLMHQLTALDFFLDKALPFVVTMSQRIQAINQCNFLEVLQYLANHNEEVRVVALKNALKNLKLASPRIQKDIVNATMVETTNAIIRDIGDAFFFYSS